MRTLLLIFFINTLIFSQDDQIIKYYKANEEPESVFNDEIDESERSIDSHFKVIYTVDGEIQSIEYIQVPLISVIAGSDTLPSPNNTDLNQVRRRIVFVPLTPEKQAAMNPKNDIIQNAYSWDKWRFGKSKIEDEKPDSTLLDKTDDIMFAETTSLDSTAQDSIEIVEAFEPKEIIAIIQEDAPELKSDSVIIKETKRQRILKSKDGANRYYKKWNVFKGTLREPIPYSKAISNFYKASFDKDGILKSVTEHRIRSKLVKTFTFKRDSLGLYTTYTETYHLRTTLVKNDPHLYAYDVSELRPGWTVVYTMDDGHRYIDNIRVYDQYGIFMYRYQFRYTSGKVSGNRNFSHVTTVEYYSSEDSLIGLHKLWYKENRNLSLIEYFDATNNLLRSKEFDYQPIEKELLITLRDPDGVILDRRLKPVL